MTNILQNRWGWGKKNITKEGVKYLAESIAKLQKLTHLELNLAQ